MPPTPRPPSSIKPHILHGHRHPSSATRPTVRGGLFSNRQTLNPKPQTLPPQQPFHLLNWDPHLQIPTNQSRPSISPHHHHNQIQQLDPVARFILDALRKNPNWGPQLKEELNKLRRVTPSLVATVIKAVLYLPPNCGIAPGVVSKFFHWAGGQKGYKHDFGCYNAFAYYLNRCGLYRAADQVPELMESQGREPSEKQFEILIRMHVDGNRGLRVFYVYEKMRKFGVRPRVFLYNRVMDGLVRTGHLDLAMKVYRDFKEDGLREESITFMILVKGLCKVGRIDEVVELLGRMRENVCKPDVFAYTAMVKVLISEGNLNGCLRVWEEMKGDGVEPDVMAYATFVTGLCKGGRVERGYELFKEMKGRGFLIDRAIYGVLVDAYVRDGKVGTALDLVKDLVDSGYRADIGIYNSIINGLCSVNKVDRACKLFQVVVQEELSPDFETVKPILMSFAELKRMDDFCKLLVQMQNLEFDVLDDLSKFFSFIAKKEKIDLALEVFEYLKGKGYSSIPIYNIIMESLLTVRKVEQALLLVDEIKSCKLKPDSSTYSIAIQCLAEVGGVQEACTCYNKIMELSSLPSIAAYCALAKVLCKTGEIDAAVMLVRDCLASVTSGPMEFKYALTVLHACKSNDSQKVIGILNEMMQQECPPNEVIYGAFISGMAKHGTIEEARKVFLYLREYKLLTEAETIIYDEMLIEQTKKKTADLLLAGLKFFNLESKLRRRGSNLLST